MEPAAALTKQVWTALGGADHDGQIQFCGDGELPSCFAVTDLACASVAAATLSVAELIAQQAGKWPAVSVDRKLCALWFNKSIRPIGWDLGGAWDIVAGDYSACDGWIRLHTNAPHHRAAALRVLGVAGERDAVAAAIGGWKKAHLEAAIVAAGGCAAEMLTAAEWAQHPQGIAVAHAPLIHRASTTFARSHPLLPQNPAAPLSGVRVLDLTRVIAGPVATRFLAGYGAEVLRIDPPHWEEGSLGPEMNPGKRCARLDLKTTEGRKRFEALLAETDILLHGYRGDALDRLGYDVTTRAMLRPGLVDVGINAYGWSGPWRNRRGFDSLVQMSCGIAAAGMHWRKVHHPVPLPVQALDHATGYLAAAAAVRGLMQLQKSGGGIAATLSLARTAQLLLERGATDSHEQFSVENAEDLSSAIETTAWGPARRLKPPAAIAGAPMQWQLPAHELGTAPPCWK